MKQIIRKLASIPVAFPPQFTKTVLKTLPPLPQINFVYPISLHDIHAIFSPICQECIDILHRVKSNHVLTSKMDPLPSEKSTVEKSLIIHFLSWVNSIAVIKSVSKLSRIAISPSPSIVSVIPKTSLESDISINVIFNTKTILLRSREFSFKKQLQSLIKNCSVSVNRIFWNSFWLYDQISDPSFLQSYEFLKFRRTSTLKPRTDLQRGRGRTNLDERFFDFHLEIEHKLF